MDKIHRAVETLTRASHRLAEVMYKQAREKQAPGGPADSKGSEAKGEAAGEGEVVDAEFEDLGKNKK
jgi:molecular chaperone DnaK